MKAKKEQIISKYELDYASSFPKIINANILLKNVSAIDGVKTIPANSIDYVIKKFRNNKDQILNV